MLKKEDAKKFGIHLGNRIQTIRKAENLSIEELSEQSGLSATRIRKWENGSGARLPAVELAQLAKALKTSLDYFLDDY